MAMTCRSLLYRYPISTSTYKTNYIASETDYKKLTGMSKLIHYHINGETTITSQKVNNSSLAESKLLDAVAFVIMVIKNYT